MRKSVLILPAIVVAVVVAFMSMFIVDERETVLVLQFSKIVDVKDEPGLGFKIPFIQQIVRYDNRILSRDVEPLEVTPLDDRRLVVDAFARYRIVDVRRFRRAVGDGGIPFAENRLDSILRSRTREVLGSVSSNDILSTDRAALMLRIRSAAMDEAKELGLEVVDVRLQRTDLPTQNLEATFGRMRAEREREAADEIARGNEAAQRVRAQADRTHVELVSDAKRESQIIRGEADARSNAIFNEAFGADEEFFEFYRSLDAYRAALRGDNSSIVLSPSNDFFTYFSASDNPTASSGAARPAEGAVNGEAENGEEDGAETQSNGASAASTSGVLDNSNDNAQDSESSGETPPSVDETLDRLLEGKPDAAQADAPAAETDTE